jgi:hypothetical protein
VDGWADGLVEGEGVPAARVSVARMEGPFVWQAKSVRASPSRKTEINGLVFVLVPIDILMSLKVGLRRLAETNFRISNFKAANR